LVVKICDFGLSRKVGFDHTHKSIASGIGAGTRKWMPPEGIRELGNKNTTSTAERSVSYDVHPCAMVLFYVLSQGKYPFQGVRIDEVEQNIVKGRHVKELSWGSGSSSGETKYSSSANDLDDEMGRKEAMHLITKMLDIHPKRRPTMRAVLEHPFFMTPSEKLEVIRAGKNTDWTWLKNKKLVVNGSQRSWLNVAQLERVKTYVSGDSRYRNTLKELARCIRNVREHVYDRSRNGKTAADTNSDLARFFGVNVVKREDADATDEMLVKYFASAVPDLFLQLSKWSVH
jgi:serine/threonine protein kinase